MQSLYWFITISRRCDSEQLISLYAERGIPILYSTHSHGTAKSQVLDLWGLEETKKAIHQTVVPYSKLKELISALEKDFQIDLPDRGIALAIPLTAVSTKRTLDFFSGENTEAQMSEIEKTDNKPEMELIVAICNHGYTDEVMDAARRAGCAGGTVLHAKGTGAKYCEKFMGISIGEEKEIIYIVTEKASRSAIMQSVSDLTGASTKAHTLVFSLPVTATAGFRLYEK